MINAHYQAALSNLEPFDTLSPKAIRQLFESSDSSICRYAKGQMLHLQNEKCLCLDVILQGSILVQKIEANGSILTIARFSQGDLLGAHLLFSDHNSYPWTVTAEQSSVVLQVTKQALLKLCQDNVVFLSGLMSVISDKVQVLTNTIDTISMKTIRAKLLDYIRYEYHLQKVNPIRLTQSKKELAEKLGIQRTSLSRELSKMKREGQIDFDSRYIYLLNLPEK